MIRNSADVETYIYHSYMEAKDYLEGPEGYDLPDIQKRSPDLLTPLFLDALKDYHPLNIVVTGSKGKGSVSYMLASIFSQLGFTVGLFTSPHILNYRERIRIGKDPISVDDFCRICEEIRPKIHQVEEKIQKGREYISPIGISAYLALTYFREKNTRINIFECGKGAATDDVNRIPHEYAVINMIFREHLRELGPAFSDIASNKAAVITKDCKAVYTAVQDPEALRIINEYAAKQGKQIPILCDIPAEARLNSKGLYFSVDGETKRYADLFIPMLGEYQAQNASLAIRCAEGICSREPGFPSLTEETIRTSFRDLSIPGRCSLYHDQKVDKICTYLLDACINAYSAEEVITTLKALEAEDRHADISFVICIPEDKDDRGVIAAISQYLLQHPDNNERSRIQEKRPLIDLTDTANPHYRFSESQLQRAIQSGAIPDELKDRALYQKGSLNAVMSASKGSSIVCILGTTSLISEVYPYLRALSENQSIKV